jgi:putative effector of murein hydrolase LrgA (UPF0299 family)
MVETINKFSQVGSSIFNIFDKMSIELLRIILFQTSIIGMVLYFSLFYFIIVKLKSIESLAREHIYRSVGFLCT